MVLSHISKVFKKPQFSQSIFASFAALTLTLLLSTSERCLANTYYIATDGSDKNNGSLSAPWKTLKNSISKLHPADTLYLRGGTWYARNIGVDIQVTESDRITIKNYPNEIPTIDGGGKEFRTFPLF